MPKGIGWSQDYYWRGALCFRPEVKAKPIPVMPNENQKLLNEVKTLKEEIKQLKDRKKYGIVWEEKPEQVVELCKEKLPVLIEDKSKEIEAGKNKPVNILIEGENYHSLSVLNYTHKEAVDLIYIDPPYNTGTKDFIFNDHYVDKEDSYRHSKWITFMYKRLKLARNLLKKDGTLFISIDENELYQLKLLCDEIFSETNFLSNIKLKVKAAAGVGQEGFLQDICEYVLVYAKDSRYAKNNMPNTEEPISSDTTKTYNKVLKDFGKDKQINKISGGNVGEIKVFEHKEYVVETIPSIKRSMEIYYSNFSKIFRTTNPQGGLMQRVMPQLPKNGLISIEYIPSKGKNKGQTYRYYFYNGALIVWLKDTAIKDEENKEVKKMVRSSNLWMENLHQGIATEGGVDFKNGKKPVQLIKNLINLHPNKNALILDFFAGSGTTGESVLELNDEDKNNRKFILCTNNEKDICTKICYPRLRNVIRGYGGREGIKGNLKYFKTDFVNAESTDKNKKALVDKSTEMLCLKEDCFDEVKRTKTYSIFTNYQGKYLGIIYDDAGIAPFKNEAKKLNKKFTVYIFSLDDSVREEEFEDTKDLVELKPIPAVILNVYKRIFK